jgi:c-di-GMP-binding flagellar brake protein YcgR
LSEHFRRIDPRYDRQLSVEIVCGGESHTGLSVNVSLGGMFVECPRALPIGAEINLRFKVPTQPELIEVGGDVRWFVRRTEGEKVGLGVRFQGLRAREVWALNRFFLSSD